MNMDPARKAAMMKRTNQLNLINCEGNEPSLMGDENNNMSYMEGLLDNAEQIKETMDEDARRKEMVDQLCNNYNYNTSFEVNLPITQRMQKLKTFIASYPFCIIQGSTGIFIT